MNLLVLSDFHVFTDAAPPAPEPSYIKIGSSMTPSKHHPVASLNDFLEKRTKEDKQINCDLVLCPGDLGDKASSEGVLFGWTTLNDIARLVDAPKLAATAGNHDVIRDEDATISNSILKSLTPSFPVRSSDHAEAFWNNGYCIIKDSDYNLVLLNSCFFHSEEKESKRGMVASSTIEQMIEEVKHTDDGRFNILLCHHHPHLHENLGLGTEDVMKNGSLLLERLGQANRQWLVIHGHKHHAKISHAAGGANPPLVLASGSFSAKVSHPAVNRAGNQLYLIKLEKDESTSKIKGHFESLSWVYGEGWETSQVGRGLPGYGGFGWHGDLEVLSQSIETQFSSERSGLLLWQLFPETRFLLPQDIETLRIFLKKRSIRLMLSENGEPYLIR